MIKCVCGGKCKRSISFYRDLICIKSECKDDIYIRVNTRSLVTLIFETQKALQRLKKYKEDNS